MTNFKRTGMSTKQRRYLTAGRSCAYCGDDGENGTLREIDHIEAVSVSGNDSPSNLQILCQRCNRWKSDRPESVLINILIAEIKRLKAEKIGLNTPSFESIAAMRLEKY